jgi:energy-converting hydrogenase Eha subunit H
MVKYSFNYGYVAIVESFKYFDVSALIVAVDLF